MKFRFHARAESGEEKRGTIEAANRDMAVQILQQNKLMPLKVEKQREHSALIQKLQSYTTPVKQRDLLLFFREFSTLVGAKIPVAPALQTIEAQTESAYLRRVIADIGRDVEDGMSISESFGKHSEIFTSLMINMIRAGEVSGNLQGAIQYVSDSTEQSYQLTSKVRGALIYPIFVITVGGVIGFLTIAFILPRLTGVIKDLNVEVPWYTQFMIWLGDFMNAYWWIVLLLMAGFGFGSFLYIKSKEGKREWDRIKLKIPVIGDLFRYVYLTRFAENLSVLMAGGIPIVRALIVVSDVVDNHVYKNIILRAAEDVKVGGEINTTFFKYEEIPPMVARMIKVGEETGQTTDILDNLADFYRKEVDHITKNLSTLIEPILIVFLGVGVGLLVVSVLLPIYNIAGQL